MISTFRVSTILITCLFFVACKDSSDENSVGDQNPASTSLDKLFFAAPKTIDPGDVCKFGGFEIALGLDTNNNNELETSEITENKTVCHGENGLSSLIASKVEPLGENCEAGGTRFNTGLDANKNNILDSEEISSSFYACHGKGEDGYSSNGFSTLLTNTKEAVGENCAAGGNRIDVGLDSNSNKLLDQAEINSSFYICNGNLGDSGIAGSDGNDGIDGSDGKDGLTGSQAQALCSDLSDYNNPSNLYILPKQENQYLLGNDIGFSAVAEYQNGCSVDVTTFALWLPVNGFAEKSLLNKSEGIFTLKSYGLETINVTFGLNQTSYTFNIASTIIEKLTFNPTLIIEPINGDLPISVSSFYSDGNVIENSTDISLILNTNSDNINLSDFNLSIAENLDVVGSVITAVNGKAAATARIQLGKVIYHRGTINNYSLYEMDDQGRNRDMKRFNNPGNDGVWFTEDDRGYSHIQYYWSDDKTNATMVYAPGEDGVWYTLDDTITAFSVREYLEGFNFRTTYYSGPGEDGIWSSKDDLVNYYADHIRNADNKPIGYIKYIAAGGDGKWHTEDDVVQSRTTTEYDEEGNRLHYYSYNDPGSDGNWFTQDDSIKNYNTSLFDDNGRVIRSLINSTNAGVDGIPLTSDDISIQYSDYKYDLNDNVIQATNYNGVGPDGLAFTDDDTVVSYSENQFNDLSKKTYQVFIQDSGADKTWFTEDDVPTSYATFVYDANGNNIQTVSRSNPGPDNTWYTDDDFGVHYVGFNYDDKNRVTRRVFYTNPGPDKIRFTDDDLVRDYFESVYDAPIIATRVTKFTGPGPDNIWQTLDDQIGEYSVPYYDKHSESHTRLTYKNPGEDGIWFNHDDSPAEGNALFYMLR